MNVLVTTDSNISLFLKESVLFSKDLLNRPISFHQTITTGTNKKTGNALNCSKITYKTSQGMMR